MDMEQDDPDLILMDCEETRSVADPVNKYETRSNGSNDTLSPVRYPTNDDPFTINESQGGNVVSSSAESATSFCNRQTEKAFANLSITDNSIDKDDDDSNGSDEYYYISEDDEVAINEYNRQLALKALKKPSYLDSMQFISRQSTSSSTSLQCQNRNQNEQHQASASSSRSFKNYQQSALSAILPWSSSSSYAAAAGGRHTHSSSHSSSPPLTPAAISKIPDPNQQLSQLGKFISINIESDFNASETFKTISHYAENGIHLPTNLGFNKKMAKVHEIYKRKKEKSLLKSFTKTFTSGPTFEMLLWLKTTPESVRKLAEGKDTCIAFYDRLCRALPRPIKEMKNGWRELILLCKVDVGAMYKSPHGYLRWHLEVNGPPHGSDSVKGTGKYIPNWDQNVKVENKQIVPCGQTVVNNRYRSFQLEFNEYLIFHAKQIEVMFAVDVEICEATEKKDAKTCK